MGLDLPVPGTEGVNTFMKLDTVVAYGTRGLAVASVVGCLGFSALGAAQMFRHANALSLVGVPVSLTAPVADGAWTLGAPIQRWSVSTFVAIVRHLPISARIAAIRLYRAESGSTGAGWWNAPPVLRQAQPAAPAAPQVQTQTRVVSRVARPLSLASSSNHSAVQLPRQDQLPAQVQAQPQSLAPKSSAYEN